MQGVGLLTARKLADALHANRCWRFFCNTKAPLGRYRRRQYVLRIYSYLEEEVGEARGGYTVQVLYVL